MYTTQVWWVEAVRVCFIPLASVRISHGFLRFPIAWFTAGRAQPFSGSQGRVRQELLGSCGHNSANLSLRAAGRPRQESAVKGRAGAEPPSDRGGRGAGWAATKGRGRPAASPRPPPRSPLVRNAPRPGREGEGSGRSGSGGGGGRRAAPACSSAAPPPAPRGEPGSPPAAAAAAGSSRPRRRR